MVVVLAAFVRVNPRQLFFLALGYCDKPRLSVYMLTL